MYINVFNNFICTFVKFISIFLHSNSETIVHLSVSAINNCSLPCAVAESVIPVGTCVHGLGVQYNVHVQSCRVLAVRAR